jgi:hypothetical protein
MKIDLDAVYTGQVSYAEMMREVQHADLYRMTDELFDALKSILAKATDGAVHFVPSDPTASDHSEQGWTLSHVVTHLTATLEEAAATAAMLARGVQVEERLRSETPWQKLTTLPMVQARLQESRRACRAFLDAWPDAPHLNVTRTLVPLFGPMDAVGFYAFGIAHGQGHLDQLRETVHQSTSSSDL